MNCESIRAQTQDVCCKEHTPKYKGKNVANPIATILAGGLMLEELGGIRGTNEIGDAVVEKVKEL